MAKVQKTFLINEELHRLVRDHENQTGASFTRTVTAALLQYFFQDPEGPNPVWMEEAIGLEYGEHTVADMPERMLEFASADGLRAIEGAKEDGDKEGYWSVEEQAASRREDQWQAMIDIDTDDAIMKIMKYRSDLRKQR
jgi:hypothetical protein